MVKTVNILGTEYRMEVRKRSEDEFMGERNCDAYCSHSGKFIVIADLTEKEFFSEFERIEIDEYRRHLLRHEIVHAFLNESGLSASASTPAGSWAKHEEMVDWIAIQFPKMQKVFEEVGAL